MRVAIFAALLVLSTGCAPWRGDARSWAPAQATIASELAALARPITGSDGALAVEPLFNMISDARIVGLGEGTHGTREFREVMNALVLRAAADERPLVVALEMDFNTGLMFDAWVTDGWFAPDPAVNGRSFDELMKLPLYATQEHRALFEAIRAHNRAGAGPTIRMFGVDVCMHPSCAAALVDYLVAVDPEYEDSARAALAPMKHRLREFHDSPALVRTARAQLAGVRARLEERRERYIALRGAPAHAAALRQCSLAGRRIDAGVAGDAWHERDAVMADNVGWIFDVVPGARILVLAHNGHTGRALDRMPNGRIEQGPVMGREISRRFGREYVAVHMTFDEGEFLAHHTRSTLAAQQVDYGALRVFAVDAAPRGTLEATLRRPGAYALDVRTAAAGEGALAEYLRGSHWTRSHGSAWKPAFAAVPVGWMRTVPAQRFDILIKFSRASATRPYATP